MIMPAGIFSASTEEEKRKHWHETCAANSFILCDIRQQHGLKRWRSSTSKKGEPPWNDGTAPGSTSRATPGSTPRAAPGSTPGASPSSSSASWIAIVQDGKIPSGARERAAALPLGLAAPAKDPAQADRRATPDTAPTCLRPHGTPGGLVNRPPEQKRQEGGRRGRVQAVNQRWDTIIVILQ